MNKVILLLSLSSLLLLSFLLSLSLLLLLSLDIPGVSVASLKGGAILRDTIAFCHLRIEWWYKAKTIIDFFLDMMSNPLDWINCVTHATERPRVSFQFGKERQFWVEKLTYHLIQCDSTIAQIINATKEVCCVYNQAVVTQYREGV